MTNQQLMALLERKQELVSGLVETPAQTLHDYHRRVGEINGINTAIEILTDLMRDKEDD